MGNSYENDKKFMQRFESIGECIRFYFEAKYNTNDLAEIVPVRYLCAIEDLEEMEYEYYYTD